MMKLSVLLLLTLPSLSSAVLNSVLLLDPSLKDRVPNITANEPTNQALQTPAEIENELDRSSSFNFDQTNLEWQTFNSSLPNGAISIYNGYVGRTDYVCKYGSSAGFYNPDKGPCCFYTSDGKEYCGSFVFWSFEILVNKDNFEFMEWKDGSYGSVPPNSVKTCTGEVYVGKNEYGLGRVDVKDKVFYLPWKGSEYWYRTYQVLTFNKDIYTEDIFDVKYKTDGVKIIEYPPETMDKSSITNHESQSVKGTATLSKTNQVEHRWDISFSITLGVKTTITAGIPAIFSTGIEFSAETTVQFTKGTTYIESITHTVSVECTVPSNYSCSISMVAYKYRADIPYTARLSRTYSNGETTWTSISGTYNSVQMGEIKAVVDRCEPVPDPIPVPERMMEEAP
ncbi:natterin-3-like isoform X2 [Sebastes umbrosus]|uniref:natterin-3-like isoform X1 n=1 Tax=Sebastes umbrosus TaxID=72105 RepID=UPI00189FABCD|nr:natterin-3-like isoform X1 [Sebastes umbrosus]XP_037633837.1 natterin-3-like isoform X2 [Sebastes umbrosus]